MLRLFAHRTHDNGIDVAGETAFQSLGGRTTSRGEGIYRWLLFRWARSSGRTHGSAWSHRVRGANGPLQLELACGGRRQDVRAQAGEQLIEHDAEGIHIAGGGHGAAENLLGAGVLRCEYSIVH